MVLEFAVTERERGWRLDRFLQDRLPKWISRSAIQKAISNGKVHVDGSIKKPSYRVKIGETVSVEIPTPRKVEKVKPQPIPLEIIYEDEDIAVINKPPGMMVHPTPTKLTGTLVNALLYALKDLKGVGGELRPGIVHRLDKDTSGVIVVAKNDMAHTSLSRQFKERTTKKTYIALVRGIVERDEFRVERPIGRHPVVRTKMVVREDGKTAQTEFRVLRRFGKIATLLLAFPKTGRTHQIRVHLKHLGHPILGDELYGTPIKDSTLGVKRQMLHALKLGFHHPRTSEWMEFVGRIPEDFKEVLRNLAELEVRT